jgi:hypothetical protein
MRDKANIAGLPSPNPAKGALSHMLLRSSQPSPPVSTATTQTQVTNTERATTITVVLETILAPTCYRHEGINE